MRRATIAPFAVLLAAAVVAASAAALQSGGDAVRAPREQPPPPPHRDGSQGRVQKPQVNGDVVRYPQEYPLVRARRYVRQGKVDGRGGCTQPEESSTLSLPPDGPRAMMERPVEVNLRTCRVVYEQGVPPRGAIEQPERGGEGVGGEAYGRGAASDARP